MKKLFFSIILLMASSLIFAQSLEELSKEEKLLKTSEFMASNQIFLKESLGLTHKQLTTVYKVNQNYLITLEGIVKYASEENKIKFARAACTDRLVRLDEIMGESNRKKYVGFIENKIHKIQ